MKRFAISQGVPEKAILVETLSNHTKENVLASLLVLDRALGLHKIKRMIAVSDAGHLRRCLLTLRTYMPGWIEFIMIGASTELPPNWWEIKPIRERAIKELQNIQKYIKEGQLQDLEVIM